LLYALDKGNNKITALPQLQAECPNCRKKVISKCGEINIWHWAHESLEECDTFSEGETQWHLKWKQLMKKDFTEVVIQNHRADILINNCIFELQNSPINPEQIREREEFYKNMIWIFNGLDFINNFTYRPKWSNLSKWDNPQPGKKPDYYSFRWKHPRKSLTFIHKRLFIDFGEIIFEIKKFSLRPTGVGYGQRLTREEFIKRYFPVYYLQEVKNG
jgi:competence protein CoiA